MTTSSFPSSACYGCSASASAAGRAALDKTPRAKTGSDFLAGGAGFDFADYSGSTTQGATAFLSAPGSNSGAALGDTYVGIEGLTGTPLDDLLVGDNNANELPGGGGSDFLFGQGGNDRLVGGTGNDQLYGGAGNDTFAFKNGAFGTDTIHDWQDAGKAQDMISFDGQVSLSKISRSSMATVVRSCLNSCSPPPP